MANPSIFAAFERMWQHLINKLGDQSTELRDYTDTRIADLVNSAPETLDTLGELAAAMEENADVVEALDAAISTKANASTLTEHVNNATSHITSDERTAWNAAESNAKTYTDEAVAAKSEKLLYVTVSGRGTANLTADKTYREIADAYYNDVPIVVSLSMNGKHLVFTFNGNNTDGESNLRFSCVYENTVHTLIITDLEQVIYNSYTVATQEQIDELDSTKAEKTMVVTITGDETNGYTSDKTIDEIISAYTDGANIEVWYGADCHTLAGVHTIHWLFTSTYQAGIGATTLSVVDISTTGAITIKKHTLATSEDTATITEQLATKQDKTLEVIITGNETDGYTMDKSCDEIRIAYANGQNIIALKGANIYTLSACGSTITFALIMEDVVKVYEIYDDDDIIYTEHGWYDYAPKTMIVTVTGNATDGWVADKTATEIKAYYDAGGEVIAKVNNLDLKLILANRGSLRFSATWMNNSYSLLFAYTSSTTIITYTITPLASEDSIPQITTVTIPAGRMRGDIDGDGYITNNDFNLLQNHLLGTQVLTDETQLLCADINNSNSWNTVDKTQLNAMLNGAAIGDYSSDITNNWTVNPNYATEAAQFYKDITVAGLTPSHNATVIVKGFTNQTKFVKAECLTDAIRIYVTAVPIAEMTAVVNYISGDGVTEGVTTISMERVDVTAESIGAATKTSLTLTLAAASWADNSITVTATGATADNTIFVAPAPTSQADYTAAGVMCTSQAANSLSFTCTSVPAADLSVNIVIFD